MKYLIFLLFFMMSAQSFSATKGEEFLSSCPLTSDVKSLIHSTGEKSEFIQHKIVRDIKAKLYQSYTNNEITPLSKERLTTGIAFRWEDMFGYSDRQELNMAQGKSLLHGQKYRSKELLKKWVKFYFSWKWGRIYKKQILDIAEHAKQRSNIELGGLRNQIQKVRWAELLNRSEELLAVDSKYQSYFSNCSVQPHFNVEIEAERSKILEDVSSNSVDKDLRVFCDSEHQRFKSQLADSYKKVKFNFGTSYGQNRQLGTDGRSFGDVRAMIDMEISLDAGSIPETKFEQCDFEIRQLELEGTQKKNSQLSSLQLFDKNLATIKQMNKLLSSPNVWSSFSDSEGISLMQEYVLSIEHLVELDYQLSNESLANNLVDTL